MNAILSILVVVGVLAFGLLVVGPFLVWLVTALDVPQLHWWERDDANQDSEHYS